MKTEQDHNIEFINLICTYEYRSVLMKDIDKKKIFLYGYIFASKSILFLFHSL